MPPGWLSPRSASISSPTAFMGFSSPTGRSASMARERRPPIAITTVSITFRPIATCFTATISRRSPAPARWSVRCWPRRWATCRERLDPRRRGICGRGPGHDRTLSLDPARRPLPRRYRARRDGTGCGHDRGHRHSPDLRHCACGACPGCGQGARRQPLGHVCGILHHPDRGPDGHLQPVHPPRPYGRNVAARLRAAPRGVRVWQDRLRDPRARGLFQLQRRDAGADYYRLWLRRFRASGMAAAGAARLSLDLPQDRHHCAPCRRHHHRAARSANARGDQIHRRQRAGLGRQRVPVPVHHHRLRSGVRLAFAYCVRNNAQDDRE